MRRRRLRWLLAGGVVLAVVAVVFVVRGGDEERRRVPLAPTTTRADLSGVGLQGVDATTTSTVPENVGMVVFRGVVKTSDGDPVPFATVRAEWFRVDPAEVIEVLTDSEGRYEITDVAPGRWRIRAWQAPEFATGKVEELFVTDETERELDLTVEEVEPVAVTWDIEPDPPVTGHNAELVVVIVERTVDSEGRTITTPATDVSTTLVTDEEWIRVVGEETETTDDDGRVSWVVRCQEDGRHDLAVSTVFGTERLDVAACIPITATTTTTSEAQDVPTTQG